MSVRVSPRPAEQKKSAGRTAASVLLAVILFVSLTLTCCLYVIREQTKPEAIYDMFGRIDLADALEEAGVNDRIYSAATDAMYDTIGNIPYIEQAVYANMSKRLIRTVLRNKTVEGFITDTVTEYITAAVNGDFGYSLSFRRVINIIRRNEDFITDEFGIRMTEYDYERMEAYLNDTFRSSDFSLERLLNIPPETQRAVSIVFSKYALWFLYFITAVLVFLLFIINRKQLTGFFAASGAAAFLTGVFLFAVSYNLPGLIKNAAGEYTVSMGTARLLAQGITDAVYNCSAVTAGWGIGFFIVCVIIKITSKGRSSV